MQLLKYIAMLKIKLHIIEVLTIIAIMISISSCSSSRSSVSNNYSTCSSSASEQKPEDIISLNAEFKSETIDKLLHEAESWLGTKYKYGGNDRDGIDCSGFVLQVFDRAFNIKLPRTSLHQFQFCKAISRKQLQPGDLVFFTVRGGSKVGHVGIYIGDNKMIHASSSQGVIITSLSQKYYTTNYYGAGRINDFYTKVTNELKRPAKTTPTTITPKSQESKLESGLENSTEYFD